MASTEQHYCLRWNNHKSNMMTVFQELYSDGTLTDVTIGLSDGLMVECHKLVLAACSPYFRKILQNMNRPRALILVNVKYYQMKALLTFMYHGEVTISNEDLPELLEIANYLKIKGLVEGADIPDSSLRTSSPIEQNHHALEHSQAQEHHQQRRLRRDRHASPSPPPISSSRTNYLPGVDPRNGNGDHMSPPHSTSSPYYVHHKSSPGRAYDESRYSGAPWTMPLNFGTHFASSLNGSSLSAHHASMLAAHYDEMTLSKGKLQGLTMGRDTPILRTVLGQGNADSSQVALLHPDNQEYRSPSNHSASDNVDSKRNINGSQTLSPYDSVVRDTDKKSRTRANGESHREWKRYKQYTKADISAAIEAVKHGMSALQAARKFGVPSRTLYDKVKKMGIANSRTMRRNNNSSGASFPFGIGGNKNGRIYAQHAEDYENPGAFEGPEAMIEPAYIKTREESVDRDSAMELSRVTPSPSPNRSIHARQAEAEEDQVEDLSMSSKKSDLRVIVSPGIKEEKVIKEEKIDSDNLSRK